MKQTEKPWIIETKPAGEYEINHGEDPENYEGECDDVFVSTTTGFTIAKVYNPDAQFIQHGEMPIARLIANSPELLTALEKFLNISYYTEDENYEEVSKAIEYGNKIINKVKGE